MCSSIRSILCSFFSLSPVFASACSLYTHTDTHSYSCLRRQDTRLTWHLLYILMLTLLDTSTHALTGRKIEQEKTCCQLRGRERREEKERERAIHYYFIPFTRLSRVTLWHCLVMWITASHKCSKQPTNKPIVNVAPLFVFVWLCSRERERKWLRYICMQDALQVARSDRVKGKIDKAKCCTSRDCEIQLCWHFF